MVDALKTAAVSRCFFGSRFVSCYWRSPAGLIKFKGSNLNVSGHTVKPFTPRRNDCAARLRANSISIWLSWGALSRRMWSPVTNRSKWSSNPMAALCLLHHSRKADVSQELGEPGCFWRFGLFLGGTGVGNAEKETFWSQTADDAHQVEEFIQLHVVSKNLQRSPVNQGKEGLPGIL